MQKEFSWSGDLKKWEWKQQKMMSFVNVDQKNNFTKNNNITNWKLLEVVWMAEIKWEFSLLEKYFFQEFQTSSFFDVSKI